MFIFRIGSNKEEVLARIQSITKLPSAIPGQDGVSVKVSGNRFTLHRKSEWVRNPFMRYFSGCILEENGEAVIKGRFVFPYQSKVAALLFTGFMVYKHISALVDISLPRQKAIVTLLFTVFYLTEAGLFAGGVLIHKKEERQIALLLEGLALS